MLYLGTLFFNYYYSIEKIGFEAAACCFSTRDAHLFLSPPALVDSFNWLQTAQVCAK